MHIMRTVVTVPVMSCQQAHFQLLLHPRDAHFVCPLHQLVETLRAIGFVGASFAPGYFEAGKRFWAHVTLLGCSPQLDFTPQRNDSGDWALEAFCYVHLPAPTSAPEFRHAGMALQPRCPHCRARFTEVPLRLDAVPDAYQCRRCNACGVKVAAAQWDWRREAVFARQFIEVGGLYPHEAVPQQSLLSALAVTGLQWDYSYARFVSDAAAIAAKP